MVTTPGVTITGSGGWTGGAVGGGSWAAVETLLPRLDELHPNGWLGHLGRPLQQPRRSERRRRSSSTAGISSKVARPYARRLAIGADCSHFIGGSPHNRLAPRRLSERPWAENIGCRGGNARSAVLATHLFFQSEKSYSGGHYVNMMNAKYDRVGIGVWVAGGRVRLVVDFYHP